MLKPLIVGNWKMNTLTNEGAQLVAKLRDMFKNGLGDTECVIAPPFTSLHHLNFLTAASAIKLCGQDVFWEKSGAYTGEVSGAMLKDVGCEYVIVGHSERRLYFGETDKTVNQKIIAALKEGLKPIVCVGETLDERESKKTIKAVTKQVRAALKGLGPGSIKDVTIAYEPVWAIGTGKNATPQQAEEVHNSLRELLYEEFGRDAVSEVRIIYGGSVKPDNIDNLMAQPNIDGALVGGAALSAEDFARIVRFKKTR